MHVFDLTRTLIDIPSVTPEEGEVGQYLYDYLSRICATHNGVVEKEEIEPNRWNVFATFGKNLRKRLGSPNPENSVSPSSCA